VKARRAGDLLDVAGRLSRAIGPEESVLVGALAVAAHGYIRTTDDVDLVARLPLADVVTRLRDAGIQATLRKGDTLDRDFSTVRGTLDGVRFDVLPPLVVIRWEKAEALSVEGRTLRVVDLEDLLRLKMRAGGIMDLVDAAMLVLIHPEVAEAARAAAAAYRLEHRFQSLLEDQRLRAQAREQRAAQESRPRRSPRAKRRSGSPQPGRPRPRRG
jgi:hypothetical protein